MNKQLCILGLILLASSIPVSSASSHDLKSKDSLLDPSDPPTSIQSIPQDSTAPITQQEKQAEVHIENQEIEAKIEEEKGREQEMDLWVRLEMEANEVEIAEETISGELFEFQLKQGTSRKFVFLSMQEVPVHVSIQLFQNDRDNHFFIPNRPAENSFVKVEISPLEEKKILLEKRIYVESSFKFTGIRNTSTYSISFVNQYSNDLYVSVDLERQQSTPNIVNSSTMDPIVGKAKHTLDEIQAQIAEKRLIFKSEIGFMQREEEHQASMLWFAGVELLLLITAAMVQMFCLRSLVDNRSLV